MLFLYKEVLQIDLPWLSNVTAAQVSKRLPVALTPREVRALLHELNGVMWLIASLLYGTGMRVMEGLRLRVKDIDFERREILIREGKGDKDRVTMLPENLISPLRDPLETARQRHNKDLTPRGARRQPVFCPAQGVENTGQCLSRHQQPPGHQ